MKWFVAIGLLVGVLFYWTVLSVPQGWTNSTEIGHGQGQAEAAALELAENEAAVAFKNKVWTQKEALQKMTEFGECAGMYEALATILAKEEAKSGSYSPGNIKNLSKEHAKRHALVAAFFGAKYFTTDKARVLPVTAEIIGKARTYYARMGDEELHDQKPLFAKLRACTEKRGLVIVALQLVHLELDK